MSAVIVVPEKMGLSNFAETICAEASPKFVPNFIADLRWPEPVPRSHLNRDFSVHIVAVAFMIEGRPEPWDFPYIIASRKGKKAMECRVWARLDRTIINRLPLDRMPKLWEVMIGGEAEFSVGKEGAFDDLLKTVEARKEELVFAVFDAEDDE
jgi:hypothetical protein